MKITLSNLRKLGACSDQADRFASVFGDEADINDENLAKAVDAGFDFEWLAERTLRPPAEKLYHEATASAEKLYDEATAPARKLYDEAIASAEKLYDEATAPARKLYHEATASAWKLYHEATAPAWMALYLKQETK